jgi:hypothetical protein
MMKMASENIVLEFCDKKFGYEQYLTAERMEKELIKIFVQLLVKAFECNSMREQIARLILPLPSSNFILKHVYNEIKSEALEKGQQLEFVYDVINLYYSILEINPSCFETMVSVRERLEILIKLRIKDQKLSDHFEKKVVEIGEFIESSQQPTEKENKQSFVINPPNDFSRMSIIPNFKDLKFDQTPFLRENITNGAYQSVNHYLDVQFRLLREDYMKPLREGLTFFIFFQKKTFLNFFSLYFC